jgi:hypothetical protein
MASCEKQTASRSRFRRNELALSSTNPLLLVAALEVVAARQNVFRRLSGGVASFSDPVSTDVDDGMDVTFGVVDTSSGVQARVWVLARPHSIVTLTFLRYQPLLEPGMFLTRCAEIRATLALM